MHSRATRSAVTCAHPFRVAGHEEDLPAGDYQVDVDEALLEGLSFEADRRAGTCLLVGSQAGGKGSAEIRPVDPRDLEAALVRERTRSDTAEPSDAALSAQEYSS